MKSGTGLVLRGCIILLFITAALPSGSSAQESTARSVAVPQQGSAPPTSAADPASQSSVSASGATTNSPKSDDSAKRISDKTPIVTLGPGDLVEINVFNVPELNSKARVSNSGDIYLPLIDYVHVAGLTQEEAQSVVEKRLTDGGFVRNPHVTIFVDEAMSQGVTVMGEVSKPGIYPDIGDHKLYEMITQAGGFSPNASRKLAIIRRNQPDPIQVNLPRNLTEDLSGNVEILPGDTINVPRAPTVYVVGDVGRPSAVLVDNGTLTVLQALAIAGGTNKTAKLGGSRILRKGPSGEVVEKKVEIKKMLEAKLPDIPLQADDILFVPVSGGRVLAGRTFDASMSVATALALYTVRP